jgi:hypothetical protein
MGQKDPSSIGIIPHPLRNPGQERDKGGVERIGKVQSKVEPFLLQLSGQLPPSLKTLMKPGALVEDHPVNVRTVLE